MPTKTQVTPTKKRTAVKKTAVKPKRVSKKTIGLAEVAQKVIFTQAARHKDLGYTYAVGRRKTAIARVRRIPGGDGSVTINGLPIEQYFLAPELQQIVRGPIELVSANQQFSYSVRVTGGGNHSQSEAIRHGIARTLLKVNAEWRPELKQAGWLMRDARVKERKKPGLHRARRAPQWQKR